MPERQIESHTLLTVASYAIGAAITVVIFWGVSRIARRSHRTPEGPHPIGRGQWGEGTVENSRPDFERQDASVRSVLLVGIGFVVVLSLVVVITTILFFALTGTGPQLQLPPPGEVISESPPTPLPPPPRLETQPGQTLSAIRAQEDMILNSYAWVDRAHGVVRIPIDRAMALVVEQGLPTRPGNQQGYQDTGTTVPSGASSGRATEELEH